MKAVTIFAKDCAASEGRPACEHLFAVDEAGRIWERFSDDPPGQWLEVPFPIKAVRKPRKATKRA